MGHSHSALVASDLPSTLQASPSSSSRRVFTYTPLKHPRNFRILRLTCKLRAGSDSKDWRNVALHGKIVEASLDRVPKYFALSYTWGNPSLDDSILIDACILGVTQNCADALRCMLRGKNEIMIWVDSVCINQAGDKQALKERGVQVALMDEIYSKAVQVNVHLGMGDEQSDIALDAVDRLWRAFAAAKLAAMCGVGKERARKKYEEVADDVLEASPEIPHSKLHGLFRLPWFHRTWVVQEVVLAKKAMFYCGDSSVSFDNLVVAVDFALLPYSKLNANPRALHWKIYLEGHYSLAQTIRAREKGKNIEIGLENLLLATAILEATRPEDKVYGLFGVAKRLGCNLPIPDYTKSVGQVYTETTLACMQQSGKLDILKMTEGTAAADFALPSWVPNFSEPWTKFTPTHPPKMNLTRKTNKSACGQSVCQGTVLSEGAQLKVLGRRLDQVAAVGEPWKVDSRTTNFGDFGNFRDTSAPSGQALSSLIDSVSSWFEIVLQRNHRNGHGTNSADENAALQDLAHLLLSGQGQDLIDEPLDWLAKYFSILVHRANTTDVVLRRQLIHPGDDLNSLGQIGDFFLSEPMQRIIGQLSQWVWSLALRTDTQGYLGMGSYSAQPGDLVVVLHGMTVPCLLRACPEGFNYVSTCIVDGIMKGEFWNAGSDEDDEWFVLI